MMEKLLFWTVWDRRHYLLESDYGTAEEWEKIWSHFKDQDCIIRMQTIFAKADRARDEAAGKEELNANE